MSTKMFVWLGVVIGSVIGGYVPTLFGHSFLSLSAILGNGIGSVIGIFVGLKIGNNING